MLTRAASIRRERRRSESGRRPIVLVLVSLTVLACSAAAADAASLSSNWAGYGVVPNRSRDHFERVVGAWKQPAATCSAGHQSYSAFWVGLGGLRQAASALEQTGTEADCSRSGHASYASWYELVPASAVHIKLNVRPGDTIAASVAVSGRSVLLRLRDETTRRTFSKRVLTGAPDTSSAEWIAEAPSTCLHAGCFTLPLANFGSVRFTGASAQTRAGRRGSISNTAWSAIPIDLQGDLQAVSANAGAVFDSATPGVLTNGGSAFTVSWHETTAPASAAPPSLGPPPSFLGRR